MAWNEQQYPAPQSAPRPEMGGGLAPGVPETFPGQPLQGQAAPAERNLPKETYLPGANPLNQMVAPPMAPAPGQGQMAGVQPAPQQPAMAAGQDDDSTIAADDVTWINRAKRVITETQSDPHRQVQLIQHLRAAYLRQRFGRNVHTDEG